ncbi:MAG TPA: endolytic transglycosylase MltG [Candidatus Baltobacteraceae bacterium]|nr:endolytic transglycosylase MltG [Candidatus Baltobacteraceae bacterium]
MRVAKWIAGGVCVVAAAAVLWFSYAVFADRSQPHATTRVIVQRGATFRQIAEQLAQAGVVNNATAFRLYAKLRHADTDVHAGEFSFPPHQTTVQVLGQLQSGGAQIAKWVTIPEGFTAKQIAQRLQENGFGNAAVFEHAFLHDTTVAAGQPTANLEGYLFPSTYLLPIGATPQTVERILTTQFQRELPPDAARKAAAHHLTVPQVITLASLIEREAKAPDERALIAGVYYNRLRLGMPLEVDASIEYALAQHHSVITYSDLKVNSPYNTYLHQGLPPTPIANPGLPSIQAALNPHSSDFLYYVYKGNGHHAFAKTLAEQDANIAKYLK